MATHLAINPEPAGGFSFTQMLPTLVFDVAMPILAFNALTSCGVSTLWALLAGGLFPAINNLRVWARSRRLEPLGIIVMIFLVIDLPRLVARRAAADVLRHPAVRRRRRSGAARMVELPLAGAQLSHRATLSDRSVGNRLSGRSAPQGWLCGGPATGPGRDDLTCDGIRRDDPTHHVDAERYACGP